MASAISITEAVVECCLCTELNEFDEYVHQLGSAQENPFQLPLLVYDKLYPYC